MANPKSEIWGAPSTWIYSLRQSGLETTPAKLGNFDKPKTAYFGTGSTSGYEGSLLRAINVSQKLVANEFLDESICPCGQDSTVSPWGKIAIFNKNNNGSAVPEIQDFTDRNINWFFADKALSRPLFYRQVIKTHSNFIGLEQYAPKQTLPVTSNNAPVTLCPYVSWGLKSLVLSIEVGITLNDANPVSGSLIWVTLDDWKNNYSTTHYMTGLRFFVRGCTSVNDTTLALTYNNDGTLPAGEGCSGLICPMNKITVKNGGEDIPTQFLYFMGFQSTTRRAHIFTPTEQIVIDSSTTNAPNLGVLPCWNYFQSQTIQVYHPNTTDYYYYYKIPYSDDTYNKIMAIAALFGCFFTPTNKYVFDFDMLDNDLYLPIIDENGVGHGQYTRGAENANNSLYTKNSIRDIDYDPDAPPTPVDPNTYNNTTVFNVIGAGASMNKRYLLDAANVAKLSTDLFDICDDMSTGSDYSFFDSKVKANMLTQSPIDSIVSLIRYPFTPTHGSTKQPVKLGRFEASAEGYPISNAIQTITFAGVDIFPRFGNNFLDYEPYTKYEVYVPFCDTVELSAADILGHTLNVRLVVDLFTGVCTGYILADSLCIETTSGNVGVSLPLTGLDTATINANIANAEANKKAAKKNYIKGHFDIITQKDKVGALWTQILGTNEDVVKKADYDLKHIETPMHTIGAASPLTSWAMDLNARVIIYYPTGDAITDNTPPELRDLSTYAHTTGFATIDNAVLSNYSGFTVATNAILNFAATTTEKEMIESTLNGGIFI